MRGRLITADDLQATLTCIRDFMGDRGYPPSITELGECLDLSRTATWTRVQRLVDNGLIEKVPDQPRTIRIVDAT